MNQIFYSRDDDASADLTAELRARADMPQPEPSSYEKAVEELDQIVKQLEQTQNNLDQSVDLFRRGLFLANWSERYLDGMEEKIRQLAAQDSAEGEIDGTV